MTVLLLAAQIFLPVHSAAQAPTDTQVPQGQGIVPPPSRYDPAIFQNKIPADQLAFLNDFAGKPAGDLNQDKQFRKVLHSEIPDCTFHYGWDTPLASALDTVLKGSPVPVRSRDGRYITVTGHNGPILGGRGMLWIDMQEGIVLGAFYFHPTNGEPTPTLTVFSKQVKEKSLILGQLPVEFAADLSQWIKDSRIPRVTTRYFIGGSNRRILLEHDEDYCAPVDGTSPPPGDACLQMDADAADIDVNGAYYLEQVNHATNATAWMIVGEDQVAWIRVRDGACRAGAEPLRCRIRMTRERTHVIINRSPVIHSAHR
jgi:uncharacterized protein YecT (DUF1311 family)